MGFVKNFTTGGFGFEPSKSWTFGIQALIGIEASWNADKAAEIAAKNKLCGVAN